MSKLASITKDMETIIKNINMKIIDTVKVRSTLQVMVDECKAIDNKESKLASITKDMETIIKNIDMKIIDISKVRSTLQIMVNECKEVIA